MQLEAGKYYRTRDGRKAELIKRKGSVWEGRLDNRPWFWWPDGAYTKDEKSPQDLVAEWVDKVVKKPMQLKIGGRYKNEKGFIKTILSDSKSFGVGIFWADEEGFYYFDNGDGVSENVSNLIEEIMPENKSFDFDKFNAVLQKSTNICSGARKDIEDAIRAGKGEPVRPVAKAGQVWLAVDGQEIRIMARVNGDYSYVVIDSSGGPICDSKISFDDIVNTNNYQFVANSIEEYYRNKFTEKTS